MNDTCLLLFDASRSGPGRESVQDLIGMTRALHRPLSPTPIRARKAYLELSRTPAISAADALGASFEPVQALGQEEAAVAVQIATDAVLAAEHGVSTIALCVTSPGTYVALCAKLLAIGCRVLVVGLDNRGLGALRGLGVEVLTLEEVFAASGASGLEGGELVAELGGSMREVLGRAGELRAHEVFDAAVRSLNRPVSLLALGVGTLQELFEEHAEQLGVTVKEDESGDLIVASNGVDRAESVRHDVFEYRRLLRTRNPRVHLTARDDWASLSEMFFECAGGGSDDRAVLLQKDLSDEVLDRAHRLGIDNADKKVQAVAFQLFKSGAFVCAAAGSEGSTDFHWGKPARMNPAISTLQDLRDTCRIYIAKILLERLRSDFGTPEIDVDVFAEMLEGPGLGEEGVDAIESLIDKAEAMVDAQVEARA